MTCLTPQHIEQYQQQGYICPVTVFDNAGAQRLRSALEQTEQQQGHPMDRIQCNKSYLLFDWADELVHHPVILDAVEQLLGPDVLCYMTNLFTKEAQTGSYVSMHQDAAYWGVEADDVVTAWVALSPATAASGVMKVEPGTHHQQLQQVNTYAKDNLLSRGQEIPASNLDPSKHVYMELEPGQMSLHHFRLVHGSDPNTSDDRRIGFAIRYVAANAKKIGSQESALLVKGENKGGFILEQRIGKMTEKQRKIQHMQAIRRQLHNIFEPSEDAGFGERIRLNLTKLASISVSFLKEWGARLSSS